MQDWLNRCHFGDCLEVLRRMPDGIAQTCVTSPPYFGLRDYGHPGQIGLEETPEAFIAKLVDVFREVRRVLREDGTCWVNMGDSYASTPPGNTTKGVSAKSGLNGINGASGKYRETLDAGHATKRDTSRLPGIKQKDLIGVPWMLAFALRQPYERVHIKDRADRAWLAALVDGEGCLTIMRAENGKGSAESYPPCLQVKMCDPECIEHANVITGFMQNLHQASPSTRGNRDTFQWRITSRRAADIVAEIYPYLRIKRKQAVVLWNHQMVRDSYETKRGQPMPDEARAKQQQCRDLIQRLNRRESVDIPGWMVEPRVAVEPGWYLRQDVIWSKPNPMPESVRDRCTKAHEYLFLLSKSERYYCDMAAIQEERTSDEDAATFRGGAYVNNATFDNAAGGKRTVTGNRRNSFARTTKDSAGEHGQKPQFREDREPVAYEGRRNRRSVWTVATRGYSGAHFATYPEELIEPCILAGAPAGGVVLDPFFGSGTTGQVAQNLGRAWIGCELNPEYEPLQRERLRQPGLQLEAAA